VTPIRGPSVKAKAEKERLPAIVWTDDLRRFLAETYSRGGLAEATKAFGKLKPDWPSECLIDCIVEEANRLDLLPGGASGKPLSDVEKEFILDHLSTASLGWIAEQLHRAETTIRNFVQSTGYDVSEQRGLFQIKDVAKELWATPRQVKRWVEKGYLWTEKRKIPVEFVAAFVEEHPDLIASKRLPGARLWLRDLLEGGHPAETASISLTEVASKLGVRKSTVTSWVRKKWLGQSGKRVTRAALRRFVREHPNEIPYQSLPAQRQNWVRALGYSGISQQRNQMERGETPLGRRSQPESDPSV
jgi:hypothetical protein